MKNYSQSGEMLTVTLAGSVASGMGMIIGSLFGIATMSGVAGDSIEFLTRGVVELPKAVGALSQGALVYWDDTAKVVTATSSGNKLIGAAQSAALSADPKAFVRLNGVTA